MAENITISMPRNMKAWIEDNEISPSALFQKVINELMQQNNTEYLDSIDKAKADALLWRERYFQVYNDLKKRNMESVKGFSPGNPFPKS